MTHINIFSGILLLFIVIWQLTSSDSMNSINRFFWLVCDPSRVEVSYLIHETEWLDHSEIFVRTLNKSAWSMTEFGQQVSIGVAVSFQSIFGVTHWKFPSSRSIQTNKISEGYYSEIVKKATEIKVKLEQPSLK